MQAIALVHFFFLVDRRELFQKQINAVVSSERHCSLQQIQEQLLMRSIGRIRRGIDDELGQAQGVVAPDRNIDALDSCWVDLERRFRRDTLQCARSARMDRACIVLISDLIKRREPFVDRT